MHLYECWRERIYFRLSNKEPGLQTVKLRKLRIKNFRGIYDLTLNLSDLTILIGRNNSGKTSILDAIRIVFENLDQNIIKVIEYSKLPDYVRSQLFGLWFFKNYRNPIEIHLFAELDTNEIDEELKELCKLKENIKGVLIIVHLEHLEDKKEIAWKLYKLDLLGYVSKTPEKALKLLNLHGGRIEGDIFSHCQIVNKSKIINSSVFNKIISIIGNKVHIIIPYYISNDLSNIDIDIRAVLRRTIVPAELLKNLEGVLKDPLLKDYFYRYTKKAKGLEQEYIYVDYRSKIYEYERLNLELFGGGEQILDSLIATLLSESEGHVFLVEEPEIHMHPAYIKGFAQVLEEIVRERNIQVISITQSPELVTTIREKSSIIGVRKRYMEIFAGPKPVTEVYKPYHEDKEQYLIEALAHELGLSPGYFFFLDVAILVEGESDEILLRHFINIMKDVKRLRYLPRINYGILKYRHGTLKTMLKVLHGMFKIKIFLIADNDEQGLRSAKEAKEIGLEDNREVFVLSKKDILCFIPSKIMYDTLKNIIVNVLKIDIDKLKEIKVKINEKEITAMAILEEIRKYGIIRNKTNLLRLLIHNISSEIPEKALEAMGWKRKNLYHTLKPIIAEKAVKSLKDVPKEIVRILTIIDNNLREVV